MNINWPSVKIFNDELDAFFPATLVGAIGYKASYDVTVVLPPNSRPAPYLESTDKVYTFDIYLNDVLSQEKAYVTVKGEGVEYELDWVVTTFDPTSPIIPSVGGTISFNIIINAVPSTGLSKTAKIDSIAAFSGDDEFLINGLPGATVNVLYPIGPGTTDYKTDTLSGTGQLVVQIGTGYLLAKDDVIKVTQTVDGKDPSDEFIFTIIGKKGTPAAIIDFVEERLRNLTATKRYEIAGVEYTADYNGMIPIKNGWLNANINIKKKAQDGDLESDVQTLFIPGRPTLTPFGGPGKIIGLIAGMEYRPIGTSVWSIADGIEVHGLAAGEYLVRIAPVVDVNFASLEMPVTVTEIAGPPDTGWELTYNQTNINSVSMVDRVISLSAMNGWDGTQRIDESLWEETIPEKMHTKLYAKFVTDTEFKPVPFDGIIGIGDGTTKPNSLTYWGFWYDDENDKSTIHIYITGANSTGAPIQLKLIKEG